MKGCELCGKAGDRAGGLMYCEADSAKLCSECDSMVHGANFLVAKHTRVLLCRACDAPTPWKASGSALTPAMSLCHACHVEKEDEDEESLVGDGDGEEEDGGYSWTSNDEEEGEGEGENQVVPWSPVLTETVGRVGNSGPPVASSSSSDDDKGIWACGGLKRVREDGGEDSYLDDDSEGETSSLQLGLAGGGGPVRITSHEEGERNPNDHIPPLRKQPRTLLEDQPPPPQQQQQRQLDQIDQGCRRRQNGVGRDHQETPKRDQRPQFPSPFGGFP